MTDASAVEEVEAAGALRDMVNERLRVAEAEVVRLTGRLTEESLRTAKYRAGELRLLSCPLPCCVEDEVKLLRGQRDEVLALCDAIDPTAVPFEGVDPDDIRAVYAGMTATLSTAANGQGTT